MGRADYLCRLQGPLPQIPTPRLHVRRVLLALLLALLVALPAAGGTALAAEPALSARLARALAVPHVDHARSGAVAVDLATGEVVFARNASRALAPASTEKLTLSFGLLTSLGPTYRIPTTVLATGAVEGSTLHGSLILEGHGDPSLSRAGLARLARQIRALGLRRITGPIVGDESFFDARRTAPGWKAWYYINESAPLSALTVDRVRYGGRVSERPALAAALLFRDALRAAGIATPGAAREGSAHEGEAAQLASIESPPLLELLRAVNGESDNFTAEILLKHLGAVRGTGGTTAAGAAVVRRRLAEARVSLAGVRIVDGSGLSLLDRVTADALVDLLAAAWADPLLRGSFLASLAVAGRSGTLEHRLRAPPVRGQVFAKTGTTSRASALSGFVAGRYAFAVVQNGPPLSSWWARRAQDRFVTVLASS
jgi:D-alanyl-D-alanine carboxypeptidase/D-alanyl-D-alanine-endopeptidase (penicillin-binding protein 4)